MKNKKGQAFILLVFILSVIVIGFVLSIMMKPVHDVYEVTYNLSEVNQTEYQQFYSRGQTMWIWLPFFLALGLLFWLIIKAHEKMQGGY